MDKEEKECNDQKAMPQALNEADGRRLENGGVRGMKKWVQKEVEG